jgi:hypothetical protein
MRIIRLAAADADLELAGLEEWLTAVVIADKLVTFERELYGLILLYARTSLQAFRQQLYDRIRVSVSSSAWLLQGILNHRVFYGL